MQDTPALDPWSPPLEEAMAPESVQPGGGLCVDLELAWGRLRRAWLRRFCPGYVRHMGQRRQGQCPNCPHDIIDSRDLKFCRNVCGYWFREDDDPFRWRDRLRLARAGLAEVVCSSLACAALFAALITATLLTNWWPLAVPAAAVGVLWFQMVWFFRDPERTPPHGPDLLLSPADGVVTHIDEVDVPDFPGGRAFRVSIYLSLWDVHLNRAPRDARVLAVRYFPGCFFNARHRDCWARNEQMWVDLEEIATGRRLRVKQISGAVARRLVCWLRPGDEIRAGDRFGMIKYGSRSDVLVPLGAAIETLVRVGDRVAAGTTPLLRMRDGQENGHHDN